MANLHFITDRLATGGDLPWQEEHAVAALEEWRALVITHVLDNRVGNTSLAHELAAWAAAEGQGSAVWRALYRAYFGEARSVFDVSAEWQCRLRDRPARRGGRGDRSDTAAAGRDHDRLTWIFPDGRSPPDEGTGLQ